MLFSTSLKDNKGFQRAYKRGKSIVTPVVVAYFFQNKQNYNRIGIATSKKIGCAVKRNRAKRIIREAYAECEALFPIGYDIVFVARGRTSAVKTQAVINAIKRDIVKKMT